MLGLGFVASLAVIRLILFFSFLFIIIMHIILQGYTNSKMLIRVWTLNYCIVLAHILDTIGEFSSSLTSDEADEADEVACGYFCCIEGGHR